ncbi:MAG: DUF309 domain-containing protein [Planctomycetota bacterium]|nr:MAG: DUF309 domain-containing protein [Planctomycetota bacterium]
MSQLHAIHRDLFERGVTLFNRGDYFEAHEVWEDLWHDRSFPERRFVQGLIQLAVGLYWLRRGNLIGARRLFQRADDNVAPFRPFCLGVRIGPLFDQARANQRHVETVLLERYGPQAEAFDRTRPLVPLPEPPKIVLDHRPTDD